MQNRYSLEVCTNSIRSAVNAENGGADRIELCDNLQEGGTTPSHGLIQQAKHLLSIPINVLIRPRGGDFLYDNYEKEVILNDIQFCKDIGVNGVVVGVLTKDGHVDETFLSRMKEKANGMSITFHRAIDMTKDILHSVSIIQKYKIDRILTSGGYPTAEAGAAEISKMVNVAKGEVKIMAAGGVNIDNIGRLIRESCADEYHFSGKHYRKSEMCYKQGDVNMNGQEGFDEYSILETSEEKVKQMSEYIHGL